MRNELIPSQKDEAIKAKARDGHERKSMKRETDLLARGHLDRLASAGLVGDGELLDGSCFGPLLRGRWTRVLFHKAEGKPARVSQEVTTFDPTAIVAAHNLNDFVDLERKLSPISGLIVVSYDDVVCHSALHTPSFPSDGLCFFLSVHKERKQKKGQ